VAPAAPADVSLAQMAAEIRWMASTFPTATSGSTMVPTAVPVVAPLVRYMEVACRSSNAARTHRWSGVVLSPALVEQKLVSIASLRLTQTRLDPRQQCRGLLGESQLAADAVG
jgi:hypothetical protein